MSDYLPKFKPGQAVTYHASADVTGGQVVEVTGDRTVGPAAASSAKFVGVAAHDAKTGAPVTVFSGGIQRPLASGPVAAGDNVVCAAAGKVATAAAAAGTSVGVAVSTAADGESVEIVFNR